MADLLASVFGGGSQVAPNYQTYNPLSGESQFLSQNFGQIQGVSNALTANTSAANLGTFTSGLNSIDAGALQGINNEQQLGNSLLSGSTADLPSWAKQYLNNGQESGAENAIGRGVGAYSDNARTGVNQYMGNNALNLVNLGAQFSNAASGQAGNIVNSNMYRSDPMNEMLSPSQFQQAGEYNNSILNQQADANAAVQNYNSNNSPLGSALRTGLQDLTYLAGSFLGGAGKMAM